MNVTIPLVSVVILCRDRACLQGTIDSALAQTYPSIEIIVVERAREGDTPALPAAVKYFQIADESEGWNFGASRALGEYVCFLHAGEELLPTYIEKCVFIAESEGVDLCASWEQSVESAPIRKPGSPRRGDRVSDAVSSRVALIRKKTFEATTGYDLRISPSAQLSDLWTRLTTAGVQASFVPEVLVRTSGNPEEAFSKRPAAQTGCQPTILLAMPYLTVGGAEAVVSQLCRQLKALGFRLFVITTKPEKQSQGDTSSWFADSTAGVYHLPRFLDVSLWPAFIYYLIDQHSVDVIWQVGSDFLYRLLPRIRELFPQTVIVDQLFNPVGHTANYLEYSDLIDHVVTEHPGMKDWLLQRGVPEETISVIPNGVNLDWYSPQARIDWRTRRPRLPDDGRLVVGFIGRLSPEKGPDLFLDIASQLGDRPDVEFVICGGGPMESQLRAAAAAKGLSSRVHFLGYVDLRAGQMPCCDIVVVCSRLDGRPNVVMEGLAMGAPVIASRVGGIPEMMPDGCGGALCEPGDVLGFTAAIRALAEDRELYRRWCAAARIHAEKNFSFAETGKRYAAVFEEVGRRRATMPISPRSAPASIELASFISNWRPRRSRLRIAFQILCMLLVPSRLVITCRNALLYWDLKPETVADHFDGGFYLRMNPDVSMSGIPPLLHYVFRGFLEGRDPSPEFSSVDYFARYPNVETSGLNPLLHYLASGRAEERSFSE